MEPHVREFLKTLQLTEKGFPEDYLRTGLHHFYANEKGPICHNVVATLAERIWE